MDLLKEIFRLWAQHREFRVVYADLVRRSDRELEDMGIARADIARLAYAEAERRVGKPAARRDGTPATPRRSALATSR